MNHNRTFLILSVVFAFSTASYGANSCIDVTNQDSPKMALLKQPLSPDLQARLDELVQRDPDLKMFLENSDFIRYLQALADNKPIDEIRPLINSIWKDPVLSDTSLGTKTGALLIGPNANNQSKLIQIIKEAELEKLPNSQMSTMEKLKFLASRTKDQVAGLSRSLKKSKQIVQNEMNPRVMDAHLFDFYGYLNLGLRVSQLREWQTPEGSFGGVKLSDIKDIDPLTFVKVLMLASQIEQPINDYSAASGEIFRLFPQASRFMGKTAEQDAYHRKQRERLYCTNSWCEEENRHEGMLENLARRILGFVLPNSRPFTADRSLSPFRPEDVKFHVTARANNELAASSTYIVLGGHAEGNTATYLQNIRGDELKHSTIFAGLYYYLQGDTYWTRLVGVMRKTLIEIADKNSNSEYAAVLKAEPISMIEFVYTQLKYEQQIKKYLSILPLKTLRKFFETDINLHPLPEEAMDPVKKQRVDQLMLLEKARREALASWPKAQRDSAYKLEYFESENNDLLSKLVSGKFNYFAGAEDYGTANSEAMIVKINSLTASDLASAGFKKVDKLALSLAHKSLFATLRDYQIMNNQKVRRLGLRVQFVDIVRGFEITNDDTLKNQPRVELAKKPQTLVYHMTKVLSVRQETATTWVVRAEKPDGFVFQPGEAVEVTIDSKYGNQTRALSVTNSPNSPYIEFAVRASDSYFKEALLKLNSTSNMALGQPKGALKFKADKPAVMIAGGIGITPFRSILQNVVEKQLAVDITLLYSNRSAEDIPFKAELDQMATQGKSKIEVNYVVSEASSSWKGHVGRIDESYLKAVVQQAKPDTVYYIVAPLPMVQSIKQALANLKVPTTQVVVESFPGYR